MSGTPLVCVLLPVRNGESFVTEAVDSILGQTMLDLELVVLDDGSTDRTVELVSDLASREPRLSLDVGANVGLAATLNRGLQRAQAPYVARMDADDIAVPHRLERQVEVLESEADVAVVGSSVALIDERGRRFGSVQHPTSRQAVEVELQRRNCVAHPSVVCRTSAIREQEGYRGTFLHAEDYDLWLRVAERHAIVNLDDELLHYRVHGGQVTAVHLEQQVAASVAARMLAARRRSGLSEGALPTTADAQFVAQLGVNQLELAAEFAAATATWSSLLLDAGQPAAAFATLDGARRYLRDADASSALARLDRSDIRLSMRSRRLRRALRLTASLRGSGAERRQREE